MTMPNFFIIGAGGCGTTSLYHYLRQHPQVFMCPVKEPNFFSTPNEEFCLTTPLEGHKRKKIASSLDEYQALFRDASNEIAIGEASPSYISTLTTPNRIRQVVPDAKLVAILKNPVDRAYTAYKRHFQRGQEPITDFNEALRQELVRIQDDWHPQFFYKLKGFYYEQLKQYFEVFDKDNIRVYLYEDLIGDPVSMMQDLFQFLGVDKTFVPDMSRKYNASYIPKNQFLSSFLEKPTLVKSILKPLLSEKIYQRVFDNFKAWNETKSQLLPDTRKQLTQEYWEDITKLQCLIHRDLSKWLEY